MITEIDGLKTHFVCEGEGENILLLHGWGTGVKPFEALIKHLSPYYKVWAFDFPGFGGTEEPKEPMGVDEYLRFTLDFCAQNGISETVLLGHSMGGRIIIKLLGQESCPLTVKKAILTDSAGIKPKKTFKAKFRGRIYKIGKGFLSLKPVKAMFPKALDDLRDRHGSADYKAASPMMRQCLVKIVNEDLTGYLPEIKASTLLIWGVNDDATPLSDGELMEKLIPDAGLVKLENAGHFAFLEQWGTFARVIDSFLDIK